MRANTCTGIIVTDTDNPESLGSIFGQFAQIDNCRSIITAHKFNRNIQIPGNHFIDLIFHLSHLGLGRFLGKNIITLGLLFLNMSIPRTRTSEHLYHRRIQDMFCCVRLLMLKFVMCIQ